MKSTPFVSPNGRARGEEGELRRPEEFRALDGFCADALYSSCNCSSAILSTSMLGRLLIIAKLRSVIAVACADWKCGVYVLAMMFSCLEPASGENCALLELKEGLGCAMSGVEESDSCKVSGLMSQRRRCGLSNLVAGDILLENCDESHRATFDGSLESKLAPDDIFLSTDSTGSAAPVLLERRSSAAGTASGVVRNLSTLVEFASLFTGFGTLLSGGRSSR